MSLGVIEESQSPWSSPVALVLKPGKVRLCLDARKLNSVTVKDAYPLPLIEGIFSRLPKARFISSLDLKDAFWQIPLDGSQRKRLLSLCLVVHYTSSSPCPLVYAMRHRRCAD